MYGHSTKMNVILLVGWRKAYFKESLQLQRNDKFLTSKKFSSFPLKFFFPLFSPWPKIYKISSISLSFFHFFYQQNFWRPFFSHFLHFLQNAAGTTAQPISSDLSCIIHSQNLPLFTPLFHSCSSKFTTTTAQFPFYDCKLHFTTAEIVISCTLKYALGWRYCSA